MDNFKNLSVAKIAEPEFISDVQEMVLVEYLYRDACLSVFTVCYWLWDQGFLPDQRFKSAFFCLAEYFIQTNAGEEYHPSAKKLSIEEITFLLDMMS